ncbi:MAG: hypothetical protein ABH851_06890, partial [Methanobacteriota archaeon]
MTATDKHNLVLECERTKTAWQAHPNRTLGEFENANQKRGIIIHRVIGYSIEELLAPKPATRPPVQPIAQRSSQASGTTPIPRPPTARPPPEPLTPPEVKPPGNPFHVSLGLRLGAIFNRGKERVQAANEVSQWFDGDQFKEVVKNHTAVAYGLCGRMRDGTADPYIFKKFNELVSDEVGLMGELGLTETGIPELEQHAQALGLSQEEFREAFFLEFARNVENKFPSSENREKILVRVLQANTTFGEDHYA